MWLTAFEAWLSQVLWGEAYLHFSTSPCRPNRTYIRLKAVFLKTWSKDPSFELLANTAMARPYSKLSWNSITKWLGVYFVCACVCLHTFSFVCECMHVHMPRAACGGQRTTSVSVLISYLVWESLGCFAHALTRLDGAWVFRDSLVSLSHRTSILHMLTLYVLLLHVFWGFTIRLSFLCVK